MIKNRIDKIKISEISEELNISADIVSKVVAIPYIFIQEKTKELNLRKDLTREEFDKLKTNFNIPCIGKMYASYYIYKRINKIDEVNEKDN